MRWIPPIVKSSKALSTRQSISERCPTWPTTPRYV